MTATRTVELWIANDESLYRDTVAMVRYETDADGLADALEAWARQVAAEAVGHHTAGMVWELLGDALGDVDWQTIAVDLWDLYGPGSDR